MSEKMREEFEALAIARGWAYRDAHGIWFYPTHGNGHDLWLGFQAATKAAARRAVEIVRAMQQRADAGETDPLTAGDAADAISREFWLEPKP
jgi:hypothetical protein